QEGGGGQGHTRGRVDPQVERHAQVRVEREIAVTRDAREAHAAAQVERQRQRLIHDLREGEREADVVAADEHGRVEVGADLVELRIQEILELAGGLDPSLAAGRAEDIVQPLADVRDVGDALVDQRQGRVQNVADAAAAECAELAHELRQHVQDHAGRDVDEALEPREVNLVRKGGL